jgi:hypothetical protein
MTPGRLNTPLKQISFGPVDCAVPMRAARRQP